MRLLYIADNGFALNNGKFYYSRPNAVNSEQYRKYFTSICFIARNSSYRDNMMPIDEDSKVVLVSRYDIKAVKQAMTKLSDDYDAVLVRNGILGCFAAKYAKQLGKILISYCGADPFEFQMSQGTLKGKIIAYLWRHLERKKMLLGDYAHYCTKVLYERYPCNGPFLICSNVSINPTQEILDKRINKIKGPHNIFKIGLMGQFRDNDQKGISTVIKALKILGVQYRLEVVGDGLTERYNAAISNLDAREQVSFLGYYSDKDKINAWLDQLDFYVQPSLSEGLSRATIEAMSRGCVVIASRVCGMIDLLPQEYLIQPKDYQRLAELIKQSSNENSMHLAAEANFQKSMEYREEVRDKKMNNFFSSITNKR